MNDKRNRKDMKLHKKCQGSKDKRYSRELAAKDAQHHKIVSDLRHQFTDELHESNAHFTNELHKSDAKAKAAAEEMQNLKQYYNAVLDDIKIKHHTSLCKQQILHRQITERKNKRLKKMWRDMEGTREMLWETFNEMSESNHTVRLASTSAKKVVAFAEREKGKSSMLYTKLKERSRLINELKNEINDEQKVILDLHSKVVEYETIIDCMEQEYEDKCNKHQTKITSMEAYYEEIIRKQSPCYVMKHWVKNKNLHG
jgi:hypothetical protein